MMPPQDNEEPLLLSVALQNAQSIHLARQRTEEALRESEERYRSLLRAITSVVWTTDAEGRFVTHQPSWSQYTGQTWEELRDFGWANALHPDDRERVRRLWEAALAARTLYQSDGRVWHAASGSYRHFEARGVPILNADGSVREWVGKCLDVEDRKQAEEALREADRRKNEFLAMLAHELRNPLAPIRNALQIVRLSDRNAEDAQAAYEMMERQINQMVRLVDDLLDVSRISRGTIDLRRTLVELASIIHQAVETCRPAIELAQHQLTVTLPPEPVYLLADGVRLAQVFSNLLNNACKYSEPNGRIWLTAERQGSDVTVTVKDAGIGIPADMLPHVFEMFTQVDRSLERSQGGLGIGLTLVQRLVELHDGKVSASSAGPGKGSEFVVRLPVSPEKPGQRMLAPTVSETTPLTARRILIVDDNRDAATTLAMLLKLSGHQTHTAFDGLEAVTVAGEFLPEVVLLDIGLPKLNGYEVCRRIREQPWGAELLLVALTGWGQEDDRRKSREAGFDSHMVKPVDLPALNKLLSQHGQRAGE